MRFQSSHQKLFLIWNDVWSIITTLLLFISRYFNVNCSSILFDNPMKFGYFLNVSDIPFLIFSQNLFSSQIFLFQWAKVVPCFDHVYKYHCACCKHYGAAGYSQIEGVIQIYTCPMKLMSKLFGEATSKTTHRTEKADSCKNKLTFCLLF